jgi:hypothetical protein
VIDRKPLAAATETSHDLVGDHDDPELVAQRADPGEIPGWRHQDPVGADNGLQDDRRDRVRSLDHEDVAQMCEGSRRLLLLSGRVER